MAVYIHEMCLFYQLEQSLEEMLWKLFVQNTII